MKLVIQIVFLFFCFALNLDAFCGGSEKTRPLLGRVSERLARTESEVRLSPPTWISEEELRVSIGQSDHVSVGPVTASADGSLYIEVRVTDSLEHAESLAFALTPYYLIDGNFLSVFVFDPTGIRASPPEYEAKFLDPDADYDNRVSFVSKHLAQALVGNKYFLFIERQVPAYTADLYVQFKPVTLSYYADNTSTLSRENFRTTTEVFGKVLNNKFIDGTVVVGADESVQKFCCFWCL